MVQGKKKKLQLTTIDKKYEEAVDEMADAALAKEKDGYSSEVEPWNVHEQKVKAQMHAVMDEYRERFARGYKVLLRELSQEAEGSNKDYPPGKSGMIKP